MTQPCIVMLFLFLLFMTGAVSFHTVNAVMTAIKIDPAMPLHPGIMAPGQGAGTLLMFTNRGELWEYSTGEWSLIEQNFPDGVYLLAEEHTFFFNTAQNCPMVAIQYRDPARWRFWKYTATGWEQLPTEYSGPSERLDTACVWDVGCQQLVLFGGADRSTSIRLNDLWVWTGTAWEEKTPASPPPPQSQHCMTYDPVSDIIILAAEDRSNNPGYIALWTWNGMDWSYQSETAGSVPWQKYMLCIRDSVNNKTVLFGGLSSDSDPIDSNMLWIWDDTSWSGLSPHPSPFPRHRAAGGFCDGQFIIAGGKTFYHDEFGEVCDTWSYDGTASWQQICSNPSYTYYEERVSMAWDPDMVRGLLLTRNLSTGMLFEWKGSVWKEIDTQLPDQWYRMSWVHDSAHDYCLLFATGNTSGKETWTYKDNVWMMLYPAHKPDQSQSIRMVYHEGRQAPVIFGGIISITYVPFFMVQATNAMFEWTGTDWQEIIAGGQDPPALAYHGLVYDSHRNALIAAGGFTIDNSQGPSEFVPNPDVWEFYDNEWHRIQCAVYPQDSSGFTMSYDPLRRRCVIPIEDGSLWEWDGADWIVSMTDLFDETYEAFGVTMYDPSSQVTVIQNSRGMETFTYADDTPETCNNLGVSLDIPKTLFIPGDTFFCNAVICNTTGMILNGYPLFVLLDVYGQYFWGPSWQSGIDSYLGAVPYLPEGETTFVIFPAFYWPENAGTAFGIRMIAAITDPGIRIIYGDYAVAEFGWTE